jgi:type II secretory pathway component PulF
MDPALQARLDALEKKIDAVYISAEKTRTYMKWTAIITIAVIVLPLLGLVFVIPQFVSYYSDVGNISNLGF